MDERLHVDGKPVELNEFVVKILAGTITGAVTSLCEIKKDRRVRSIRIGVTKRG